MTNPKRQLIKPVQEIMRDKQAQVSGTGGEIMHSFPSDLGVHMFVMNFSEYTFSGSDIQNQILSSSIALPVPQRIQDVQQINYNEAELGVAGGLFLRAADEVNDIFKGAGGGPNSQPNIGKMLADLTSTATNALTNLDAKQAGYAGLRYAVEGLGNIAGVNNAGALTDLIRGNVFNPNIALLFQHVPLKAFTFTWRLSPRSKDESTTLKNIIKKLKYYSLPKYEGVGKQGEGSIFLKYPHVVDCFFTGSDLDSLMFFKRAAVTSMAVDYSPEGLSFFAETGSPTAVDISLSFTETEIHTADDYSGVSEDG